MNEFTKRRLDILIGKISKLYEVNDGLYEQLHQLEQELDELEKQYNEHAKDTTDEYYRSYLTNGLTLEYKE